MKPSWINGTVIRVHNFRDSKHPPSILGQGWVIIGEDGEQYLISVKPGWEIRLLPDPERPGYAKMVEVLSDSEGGSK